MTNGLPMIGVGPFITIPLLMTGLGGPQALLGWIVALVICRARRSGLERAGRCAARARAAPTSTCGPPTARATWGRLMAFLFIWQFILSGPLEIASGYIGFANYVRYVWRDMSRRQRTSVVAVVVGVVNIVLLYRRIDVDRHAHRHALDRHPADDGRRHRERRVPLRSARRFDFPPGAFDSRGVLLGLGRVRAHRHLRLPRVLRRLLRRRRGEQAAAVIPRAILISVLRRWPSATSRINLSVISVVPWREFVPA